MPAPAADAKSIFGKALELEPAARPTYLDEACAGDPVLRARIDGLLAAHGQAGEFMCRPGAAVAAGITTGYEPIAERPGAVIGPYKLLEQIGEGGFGVVFLAEQSAPVRRKVALKVIKPGMDTRQVVARFEAERQALAIMDHPHIAKVHDAGATASGRPYFVMELVKGVPITDFCDQNCLSPRKRLELFVQVCGAVQHAHQKGIIHRDIKPSNVLVSRHDTTPVVKVIDFGVVKALGQTLTDKTLFTGVAQMIGTPLYMSPEQAGMSDLDVDTRSDIYSLGVLLYELLTGTTPLDKERFREAGYDEIRRIIREEEPPLPSSRLSTLGAAAATVSANRGSEPRKLSALVRGELDWIVMKALEKDRTRRYETANGLAQDVDRYLADEPVLAGPPSARYRLRKFVHRNRREVLIAGVVSAAAAAGVSGLVVSRGLISAALQRERQEAYFQRITVAHRELSIDNLAAALRALEECPEDLRGWEWRYLMRLCKVEPLIVWDTSEVYAVAFSSDGERLASGGADGSLKVWDSRTGQRITTIPKAHSDAATSVAFHPAGTHLASVGTDERVKVWNLTSTDRPEFTEACNTTWKFGTAGTVSFSPDGRLLAAGIAGEVLIWEWAGSRVLSRLPGHKSNGVSVAFSRDGKRLASASTGEGVHLWDAQRWAPIRTFAADPHPVSALAFSPDGRLLAEASLNRKVRLWDTTTGELQRVLHHTGNVHGAVFNPIERRFASAGEDKAVHLWDPATGREVLGLRGHTGWCGCVAVCPDGHRLASAGADRTIRVWDATPLRGGEGQEAFTFTRHNDEIRTVAVSPVGDRIASAGIGSDVRIWNATNGSPLVEFDTRAHVIFCLAWHPDGERIASVSWNGREHSVEIWNARTGKLINARTAGKQCHAVAFSPDGHYLVTGGGAVQVWNPNDFRDIATLGTHDREIRAFVFSSDGTCLASASGDGEVKLWEVPSAKPEGFAARLAVKQEPRHVIRARIPGPSVNVSFSTDGHRLATAGEEDTVVIRDVQAPQQPRLPPFRGHNGDVYTLAFSPDDKSRWVASGGEDSAVKVWDSHTGKLVRNFRGHTGLVSSVAFSRDGQRLYSGNRDHTVKVWDVSKLRSESNG